MLAVLMPLAVVLQSAPAAPAPASTPDPVLARMTALYDEVCLQTFPIDEAVDKMMASKGAAAITAERLRVYLHDDPGRGWTLPDGDGRFVVTIESPPFHACTIRRMTPAGFADLSAYRAVADRFEQAHDGFKPIKPMDGDLGAIHSHGVGERRVLPSGPEALFVFDNHVIDPAARARGATGVEMRFVHQYAPPGAH